MAQDRMQRQRFELKYVLEESTALAVRDFAGTYLDVDEAGLDKPNHSYRVNSIYLDSDNLYTLWDWVNSNRNRFKLRMRFYDSNPDTPVFCEIKRRVNGCILKERCGVRKSAAALVLAGQFPLDEALFSREAKHRVALENFISLVSVIQAKPKALVTYLREAYVDPENDGLRLTMDREVRIGPRETVDFSLRMPRYVQPFGQRVILELKFNNRFPKWFNEMVQCLELTRGAAAKYCEGICSLRHPELANWPTKPVEDPDSDQEALDSPPASAGEAEPHPAPASGSLPVPQHPLPRPAGNPLLSSQ